MKVTDLPADVQARITAVAYDEIFEKHEGPFDYSDCVKYGRAELMQIEGRPVLLPVYEENIPHIEIIRSILSHDGNSMTIFLCDRTYSSDNDETGYDPASEWSWSGHVAVCDRLPGTEIFVATVYHDWYITPAIDRSGPANAFQRGKSRF